MAAELKKRKEYAGKLEEIFAAIDSEGNGVLSADCSSASSHDTKSWFPIHALFQMEPAGVLKVPLAMTKEGQLIAALEYPKIRAYLQTLELDVFDVWLKDW